MMMKLGTTETTDSSKRLTPFSVTVSFLVILMMGLFAGTVKGQEIRIKLVDGRNGRVFSNQCVNVWVGKEQVYGNLRGVAMLIQTDKNGVASLHLTDDDAKVSVERGNGPCGDLGVVNPVVKYADTITILSGYALCRPRHSPPLNEIGSTFATKKMLDTGVVTENACGKIKASPEPGEIIMFVRPHTFWEQMSQ